jgi:hypothetical protein
LREELNNFLEIYQDIREELSVVMAKRQMKE